MSEEEATTTGRRQRSVAVSVFFAIVAIGMLAGYLYVSYRRTHISTDDAFIEGPVHTISSRVAGAVLRVAVTDNAEVKAGDLLVEIDPEPYEAKLAEAEAGLDAARRAREVAVAALEEARVATARLDAAVKARAAERRAKAALFRKAAMDRVRAERLYRSEAISEDRLEHATTAADAARAALRAAEALLGEARAARAAHEATIKRAAAAVRRAEGEVERGEAAVVQARLQLSYTRIVAPAAGMVTKKAVEVGDVVRPAMPIMAIVPTTGLYVVANYKETKTARIRPGLPVEIRVDAIPGRTYKGRVDSIMAGTGAAFSLFPPENATGNYVKVVQRIPVKITFEPDEPLDGLRLGMSVVPTVLVR